MEKEKSSQAQKNNIEVFVSYNFESSYQMWSWKNVAQHKKTVKDVSMVYS